MTGSQMSSVDPNSWSNPDEVLIKHIHLNLDIDFVTNTIKSSAIYEVSKLKANVNSFDLDCKNLVICSVKDDITGEPMDYTLGEPVDAFGAKLSIKFTKPFTGDTAKIYVEYVTDKAASALQWLAPEQTAGKMYPYLFTQCQAIHARSLLPCQDTPSVKFTYSAEVVVPKDLTVLMSALREDEGVPISEEKMKYKFKQPIVIPSYLIAFAVGKLESKKIGPRTHVWSEKELIDQAASEFLQTEEFLQVAEHFCGPYEWGIYDLLVLPPSFPYGGMENPCLTFVTPTLLAGDRSLAGVVAHEISHSWTGNLVTNSNFEHFWLNEGFTVFLERKILGHISGQPMRHFSAINGFNDLYDCLGSMGFENPLTQLVIDLKDVNPDDAFSSVPYEKGHTFLFYLESIVGGAERFEPFLKDYIQHFKFRSITTNDFKKFFLDYFSAVEETSKIDWNSWLYTPGLPPVIPSYDRSLLDVCQALADKWKNWTPDTAFDENEFLALKPVQVAAFLNILNKSDCEPLPIDALQQMRKLYKLDEVKNCEIQFRWLRLCIKGQWTEQIDKVLEFISSQGRMKYVRPLYRNLYEWKEARQRAIDNYEKTKPGMMFVTAYVLAKDLHLEVSEV